MFKKIDLEDIRNSISQLVRRFPAALTFLTLLTIWIILHVWDKIQTSGGALQPAKHAWLKLTDVQYGAVYYYLGIATVLCVVLRFWGEEIKNKRVVWTVATVSHLLLLADAVFLWFRPDGSIHNEILLAHAAFCTALLLAGIFLPYFRHPDDLPSWNLTLRMASYAFLCLAACGVVCGGLILLLCSLEWLFGIHVNPSWHDTLCTILLLAVAGTLWMSRLPQGREKFNTTAFTSGFLTGMVRYLFLPLVLGYLAVLYVYGAKILLAMDLPKGGVCKLIIVLMMGCLGIEILLYPLQRKAAGTKSFLFEQWLVRWLPVIILPLLVLMSVAIGRRISDYGITEDRLYVLTLNLWFYVVCAGLFLTGARRIHWVMLSFGGLFLLTSAFPVNFSSLTRKVVLDRIDRFMSTHAHPGLPMTETSYKAFMEGLPEEEADQLSADLRYAKWHYGYERTARFVAEDIWFGKTYHKRNEKERIEYSFHNDQMVQVPEGYGKVIGVNSTDYNVNLHDSNGWRIQLDDTLTFVIDRKQLPADGGGNKALVLQEQDGKGVLSISRLIIDGYKSDSLSASIIMEGYYFKR